MHFVIFLGQKPGSEHPTSLAGNFKQKPHEVVGLIPKKVPCVFIRFQQILRFKEVVKLADELLDCGG